MKKLLVIGIALALGSCFTTQGVGRQQKNLQTFHCAKSLIELKVDPKDAFEFCNKTFSEKDFVKGIVE